MIRAFRYPGCDLYHLVIMSKGEQVLAESRQLSFFQGEEEQSDSPTAERLTSTFVDNMRLPVHRWFRYSGFPGRMG